MGGVVGVVWNGEKETQKRGGGVFSVRCLPGLNESTCFLFLFPGGGGQIGGWTTEEGRGDYFKEVWTVIEFNWLDHQDFDRNR